MPYLYRSFSAKEPPIIGLFCGKWPVKIRHPVGLRHPVMQPDNIASTHGGDQTVKYLDLKVWWFSCGIFCVTGTPFTHVKTCRKIWGFPWKCVWYGDSREHLLEMLTVAIMSSPISSVCGMAVFCMYVAWQLYCLSDFWEFLPCTDKISPPHPFFFSKSVGYLILENSLARLRGCCSSALLKSKSALCSDFV